MVVTPFCIKSWLQGWAAALAMAEDRAWRSGGWGGAWDGWGGWFAWHEGYASGWAAATARAPDNTTHPWRRHRGGEERGRSPSRAAGPRRTTPSPGGPRVSQETRREIRAYAARHGVGIRVAERELLGLNRASGGRRKLRAGKGQGKAPVRRDRFGFVLRSPHGRRAQAPVSPSRSPYRDQASPDGEGSDGSGSLSPLPRRRFRLYSPSGSSRRSTETPEPSPTASRLLRKFLVIVINITILI